MLEQFLSASQKNKLRASYKAIKRAFISRFRSYDGEHLKKHLLSIGIAAGDTVLIHCAYGPDLGFQGSPGALLDAFLDVIGPDGNLLMVSMPYFSATSDYLRTMEFFDVRRTPSKMGLVSEMFRRRAGVRRSLHPTHPILVLGRQADWIISGHEHTEYAWGPGSPFEKLLLLNGKVLFFGVTEFHFTFHHYLEHLVKDDLPFALYENEPFVAKVIDENGEVRWIKTYVFTKEAISRRRVGVLFDELKRRGQMKRSRIGNTQMVLLTAADSVSCTKELASRSIYFYKTESSPRTITQPVGKL